jgi:hypothetical protein
MTQVMHGNKHKKRGAVSTQEKEANVKKYPTAE